MHVLQLLPSLTVGGVERGVLDLAKGLLRRGHRVSVVSAGGPLAERLAQLGAQHQQLPVQEKSLLAIAACIPAVADLIRSTGVDLVHARSRVPGWIGLAAARRAQRPFVTTAHGFYTPHLASRVMVWGRLVIVPSEALGRYLMERFGVAKERLRVIPRGVDLEEFPFRPAPGPHVGPWRIGLVGRLSPLKGHEIALQACARLRRQGRDVRLCLTGDAPGDPARRALEVRAASLGLGESVEWLGVRQDMAQVIASLDMVIAPSLYPESFGRTLIEAQAVGRPVIASRLGAFEEVVTHERTGLLVPSADAAALAQAIDRMMQEADLRSRCVASGRRDAETKWAIDRMVEQTLAVYEECLTQPRVLIWKLSALGDVILSTPSLRALRRQFPAGRLTLAVGRPAHEAVARCPHLNDLLIYDRRGKDRGWLGQWRFIRRIRRERFDLSVDLQNSRSTHLMAWLAGIPVRVGYRRRGGWLLNRGVRLPKVVLAPVAHQHYLLRQAGFATDGEALELWPAAADEAAAQRLLAPARAQGSRAIVGIHPGGSGRWKTKRWALERWAKLCTALAQHHIRVVVIGGKEEQPLGEALSQLATPPPLILIGQTRLMELAGVIRQCQAFVAQDSSSLHIAAAVGTPTVALFGPTDPRRHLPPTFRGQVIQRPVFCSPCYSPTCRTVTHACMTRIEVDDVLSAVVALLAEADAPAA